MDNIEKVSTGINTLDTLIDYLYIGDNVVWEVESGLQYEIYFERFIQQSFRDHQPIIYISFNSSPQTVLKTIQGLENCKIGKDLILIDCFTSGKGRDDSAFTSFYETGEVDGIFKVQAPHDPKNLIKLLKNWEGPEHYGMRYVFDSITGMEELWKESAIVLDFFAYTCPKLYDLNTIAYWMLERNAHNASFKANIRHITQVVLELYRDADSFILKPIKLARRSSNKHFKKVSYEINNNSIDILDVEEEKKVEIGGSLKEARASRGLSQKEFASRISMTPSYVSQIENDQLLPSLPAFLEICRELRIDPNTLLGKYVTREPDFIARNRTIHERLVGRNNNYSIYNINASDSMNSWLIELHGETSSDELLNLFNTTDAGLYLITNKAEVSDESGSNFIIFPGDFIMTSHTTPLHIRSMAGSKTLLLAYANVTQQ